MSTKSGHVFSSGSWSTLIAEGPVHDLRPSAHSYSDGCSVGTGLLDHIGSAKVRGRVATAPFANAPRGAVGRPSSP